MFPAASSILRAMAKNAGGDRRNLGANPTETMFQAIENHPAVPIGFESCGQEAGNQEPGAAELNPRSPGPSPRVPGKILWVTQYCVRAGHRTSGPEFGRSATGKSPKSAPRPAFGRPEVRVRFIPVAVRPKSDQYGRFTARKRHCLTWSAEAHTFSSRGPAKSAVLDPKQKRMDA